MMQKIIKVGNSYAVTIPKKIIEMLSLEQGSYVDAQFEEKKKRVILKFMPEKQMLKDAVDPEVYKVGKDLLKRYLPAFKELAQK
jgi:antitoxin component of MazEF toxin-antitoxin module